MKVDQSCQTLCSPARLLCPWSSPGQKTEVCSYSLLQGIFLTQGSNKDISHCRQILYRLSHQGSPNISYLVVFIIGITLIVYITSIRFYLLYTQKNCTKNLHNQDNHDGMITHLEPDILECEVKSITMNKASGGDGISVELFQILKDDAVKVLHSICQQIWKTHQWPQDWKRSVLIPIPKKGNAK